MGLKEFIMACYGGLWGILTGITKSTEHPSIHRKTCRTPRNHGNIIHMMSCRICIINSSRLRGLRQSACRALGDSESARPPIDETCWRYRPHSRILVCSSAQNGRCCRHSRRRKTKPSGYSASASSCRSPLNTK